MSHTDATRVTKATGQPPAAAAQASAAPEIRIQIQSNPLYLSGVRRLSAELASRLGFTNPAAHNLSLALDEALCNVIRHGYDRAPDRPIWITFTPVGGPVTPEQLAPDAGPNPIQGLLIVIEDEARQVDPQQIKSRDLEDIRPGGLGVHIIHQYMDELRYEKRDPVGMRLTMMKRRVGSVAHDGAEKATQGHSTTSER